ncbi:hypothetical protein PFX98_04695 [Paucibacter sediminis]|uniref:Uncharacterized protein n=1 Tax=Paucibacter sediminis TaxID=3019553 RepID=A0AA95NN07_9BURK|nr:hypothetical protein [Paucibacter sp. S2-9]WIT12911.1 hypothetical protein PFX98_04695 [Paucibacter sp. S2-9]
MSDIEVEVRAEVDPIKPTHEGECLSLSARSTLKFVIGHHQGDRTWHLRIAGNSGKGMWFDGWASAADIEKIVKGATELTAKSFHSLHPGRSINTGGFVLAALKELGLIRANAENKRLHEHVPTTTFAQAVAAHAGQAQSSSADAAPGKPSQRKGRGAH